MLGKYNNTPSNSQVSGVTWRRVSLSPPGYLTTSDRITFFFKLFYYSIDYTCAVANYS